MLKNITSSLLSKKTNIPHTKIKRYVREFLPPDLKATIQSGYTREFDIDEAFKVYIGAYLVSFFKFTLHEAKNIISDITPWMVEKGYSPLTKWNERKELDRMKSDGVELWDIMIMEIASGGFAYTAKGVYKHTTAIENGRKMHIEKYFIEAIKPEETTGYLPVTTRILEISFLTRTFFNVFRCEEGWIALF